MKFNRKHNVDNPYQGHAKRVLCVCSAGLLRSPTIANVLHRLYGYNTRAVGLEKNFALIVVDDVLLYWADEIVCTDFEQKEKLLEMTDKPIQCLAIDDDYEFMDEELVNLIEVSYRP